MIPAWASAAMKLGLSVWVCPGFADWNETRVLATQVLVRAKLNPSCWPVTMLLWISL